MKAFAVTVFSLREFAGLTRKELAELAGLDKDTIFKVEHESRCMSLPVFCALARACKKDPRELFASAMDLADAFEKEARR